jgi:class 3 adenylate cyclase/tetratricopeptide (TPR) repeat protein
MAARAQTVTILFTDLVSSTELLQRAGDERAQRIFKAHHRLLSEAVQAHGGHEVKWLGDGLMVAFDSARDAATCAIAMQQAARRPAAGERLEIRVGLHVGDAFKDESDYFGTSVVIARRLCDTADAGQIFASDLVVRLLDGRHEITFDDLGALALKGIDAPVHAHEMRYEHDPLAMLATTPFVGRDDVMASLSKKLDEARAGKGALAMLVGEPGIGKTRTAEEFAEHARGAGAMVLWGRCYDGEWAAPFSPFMEAIKEYASAAPPDELARQLGADAGVLARIVPMLRERLPDIAEPPAIPAEGERYRLLESAGDFFARLAASRPLVLMLDDLHWADRGTIAMLRQVARSAPQQRLLLIGAYRDIELDLTHPLADALQTLRRETNYERFVLKGLDAADVSELLSLVAEQQVPEQFAQAIGDETGGNPFFIREVMLHLVEEKKIIQEDGRWVAATAIADMRIPEGVREVIGRRLSRVSEPCGRMLTVASALTAGFSWDMISALVDLGDAPLLDAVDEALAAQLIVEREKGSYEFTHALIRHTLYEELSTPRRVLLHRQIGEALERLYADDVEPHLAELAHHFYESAPGGQAKKAIDYACRAADRATSACAWEDAIREYERALEAFALAPVRTPQQHCELLLLITGAQMSNDQYELAFEKARSAARIARELGQADLLAKVALAHEETAGPASEICIESEQLLTEALALQPESDGADRAMLIAALARRSYMQTGSNERVLDLSSYALEMARRLGDARTLYDVLPKRHHVMGGPAYLNARLAIADEIRTLAPAEATGHLLTIQDLMELGDTQAAESAVAALEESVKSSRSQTGAFAVVGTRAAIALGRGRFAEAEQLMRQAVQFSDRIQTGDPECMFAVQLLSLRHHQGRLDADGPLVETLIEQVLPTHTTCCVRAFLRSQTGHPEGARDALDQLGVDDLGAMVQNARWMISMFLLTEACWLIDDAVRTQALYRELLPYKDLPVTYFGLYLTTGSASRLLGQLATVMRSWLDAERHFDAALEANERMGFSAWVAWTQLNYGDMLLRRSGPGDRERACKLLTSALAFAGEAGMVQVQTDSERLLNQATAMMNQGQASNDG